MTKTGYASHEYASVYENEETSVFGGSEFFLKRKIPGTDYVDYSSVYPFLANNLQWLADDYDINATSSVVITNPLKKLHLTCEDAKRVNTYKSHSVVELSKYNLKNLPENHRRNIKRSGFSVSIVPNPANLFINVHSTYQTLVERHKIIGITNYSLDQIEKLLKIPGAILFEAYNYQLEYPELLGYCLFYIQNQDAYYHLSALTYAGLEARANFKIMHEVILFSKQLGLDRLEIGAVPDGGSEGLKRFKEGFATCQMNNFIIKTIYNQELYDKLSENKVDNGFFPLYRKED